MTVTCKRALAVIILATAIGGCSFKVVMPPPPPSEWPRVPQPGPAPGSCTSSVFPPAMDTTAVVILGSLAILERDVQLRATPIILATASIPVAISAIYGFIVTAQCRRYQRLFTEPGMQGQ